MVVGRQSIFLLSKFNIAVCALSLQLFLSLRKIAANMLRYILLSWMFYMGMSMMPVHAAEQYQLSAADNTLPSFSEAQEIKLSVRGKTVRVQNANGQSMTVYSLTGEKVVSIKLDATDKSVTLNVPNGIYIVKVGNVVRKVSIAG